MSRLLLLATLTVAGCATSSPNPAAYEFFGSLQQIQPPMLPPVEAPQQQQRMTTTCTSQERLGTVVTTCQ